MRLEDLDPVERVKLELEARNLQKKFVSMHIYAGIIGCSQQELAEVCYLLLASVARASPDRELKLAVLADIQSKIEVVVRELTNEK